MSVPKDVLEGHFFELLESLQPNAEYLKLFRAVVLDCWEHELNTARNVLAHLDARISGLEQRSRDYTHALVVSKSIDSEAYNDAMARTRAELTVAKMERSEARIEESDVDGLLMFAEHVLGNAAALWTSASAADRLTLQRALFPDGLTWDGTGFGTAVTCMAFMQLPGSGRLENGMASPRGFEPRFQP